MPDSNDSTPPEKSQTPSTAPRREKTPEERAQAHERSAQQTLKALNWAAKHKPAYN